MNKLVAKTGTTLSGILLFAASAFATSTTVAAVNTAIGNVANPIVELIKSLLSPILGIVGALGTLYCVILGVKYAKAEEPQDREKAKAHLKNAVIGFVLIFVLMLALQLLMPALEAWVAKNATTTTL